MIFEVVSLNDAIYQVQKFQRELTNVLLRFRRKPVELMCDIAEMYLRIEITFKGRPYQRFLRKALNQERAPGEYEFDRVVFGVNPSPFLACVQPPAPLRENRRRGVTVANCVRRPSDFSRNVWKMISLAVTRRSSGPARRKLHPCSYSDPGTSKKT